MLLPNALVADASLTRRMELRDALQAAGFRALACESAEEAVRTLQAEPIALLVLDPWLPGGGAQVAQALSRAPGGARIPILLEADPDDTTLPAELAGARVEPVGRMFEPEALVARARPLVFESELAARILLVDDSLTFRSELAEQLAESGYEVTTASSGEEALGWLAETPVDCVLLDVVMPGLGGVETCARLKADPRFRSIPVMMLTALEGMGPVLQCLHAGADDFVNKAGEPEILAARLRAHLRRKRIEDENREIRERLLQSDLAAARARGLEEEVRARDEFLSIAAHELKTPLTSLLIQVQGLMAHAQRGGADAPPPSVLPKLETVNRQVHRLNTLIGQLLDISRIAGGRLEFERHEVDLGQLTRSVVRTLEDQLSRSGSRVMLSIDETVVGWWDPWRLEQVISNLVSNAIKYGAGHPIEIEVHRKDDRACFCVRDHGIGIAPEAQARIFGRFERAVSPRHYGGLGLGLWIARQIVEAQGGSISVESEPGRGSMFRFELPLGPIPEHRAWGIRQSGAAAPTSASGMG